MTLVAGIDESDHSFYARQWALQHFFPASQPQQYRLIVVTAKPFAASAVGLAGPGAADLLPFVEADLKRMPCVSSTRPRDSARSLLAAGWICCPMTSFPINGSKCNLRRWEGGVKGLLVLLLEASNSWEEVCTAAVFKEGRLLLELKGEEAQEEKRDCCLRLP
ncbi:hypothetical protein U9M48_013245 [Paspalum notatum var. saurae]|uniref:Uncharacterized protein n=1 Tax=Paspalum notatum var. saurae TaxID=547442 RepID=A0AAQ3SZ30_PASNO